MVEESAGEQAPAEALPRLKEPVIVSQKDFLPLQQPSSQTHPPIQEPSTQTPFAPLIPQPFTQPPVTPPILQQSSQPSSPLLAQQVVEKFREKKLVLTPDALRLILLQESPLEVCERIFASPAGVFITHQRVEEALADARTMQKTREIIVKQVSYRPAAAEVASQLKLYPEREITGRSTCTGKVEDFVELFRDRFAKTSRLLRNRASDTGVTTIAAARAAADRKRVRIVGMVAGKRVTKNGHTIIDLEEEQSSIACLVPKDCLPSLAASADDVVLDETIAVDGFINSGGLFIVNDFTWPEVPFRPLKTTEEDVSVAFISDLQVGSRFFMQKQFTSFLEFLNGKAQLPEHQAAAGKVKYLLVAGDVVDGIGIYPTQEKELVTKDVYTQFEIFSEFVKSVPEHIEVIIGPGNHDPVRIAQPRPRVLPEFTRELDSFSNVHFVGDPAWFDIHGFKTLMFHGDGFYSLTSAMRKLSGCHVHPEKVGIEMLRRRHLSPVYGENPVVPERQDYLFIAEVPDIMHFGHVHHNGYANYRGTMVVNAGTWQDTTDYEIKQGHVPTPCLLPLYNLKNSSLSVIDFNEAVA